LVLSTIIIDVETESIMKPTLLIDTLLIAALGVISLPAGYSAGNATAYAETYETAYSGGSLEDAQFNLAVRLLQKGQYRQAITEFRRLLFEMNPGRYAAGSYYYAGYAYQSLGEYDRARKNFSLVVEDYPSSRFHNRALYQQGRTDYLLGKYESAIERFNAYLRVYPSGDYADNSLYWKGESLLELGRREEGVSAFHGVLKRYPLGNKADAAAFKLRLLELEDSLASIEPAADEGKVTGLQEEIARLREHEKGYLAEIDDLKNQVEQLTREIDNLKEASAASEDSREREIAEKREELATLEALLNAKEEALKEKEKQLDEEFDRIEKLVADLERKSGE
jgi:TolA-binding protein